MVLWQLRTAHHLIYHVSKDCSNPLYLPGILIDVPLSLAAYLEPCLLGDRK